MKKALEVVEVVLKKSRVNHDLIDLSFTPMGGSHLLSTGSYV